MAKKFDLSKEWNIADTGAAEATESAADSGMGKLSSVSKKLIPDRIYMINIDDIELNPLNTSVYSVDNLDDLAKDISRRGIQEPLIVRAKENGKYVLLSGHRRFEAARLAAKSYGFDASFIPCLIQADSSTPELEAIVLNNIQRDKTSYEKMMECMALKGIAEGRKEAGDPEASDVWKYLTEHYGLNTSEINRYNSIATKVIPEIKEHFKAGHLATNVAFTLSKETEETQQAIADRFWNSTDSMEATLTLPALLKIKGELNRKTKPSPVTGDRFAFQDCDTGFSTALNMITSLSQTYSDSKSTLTKRDSRRILKKLNRLCEDMLEVQAEMKK